jgi:hypothetical protein
MEEEHILLDGSQVLPVRPSDKGKVKTFVWYELAALVGQRNLSYLIHEFLNT